MGKAETLFEKLAARAYSTETLTSFGQGILNSAKKKYPSANLTQVLDNKALLQQKIDAVESAYEFASTNKRIGLGRILTRLHLDKKKMK